MELMKTIETRRAYRIIKPIDINKDITDYLSKAAQLAPSCYNNQPWNYIFVTSKSKLEEMKPALSKGNEWAYNGSLIIAVFSNKEDDCLVAGREYNLLDSGISAGFIMLAATDLGLVAHPIAGYSQKKAKRILNIPQEMTLITLIIVGKHDEAELKKLPAEEKDEEVNRPERKEVNEFIHFNEYKTKEEN